MDRDPPLDRARRSRRRGGGRAACLSRRRACASGPHRVVREPGRAVATRAAASHADGPNVKSGCHRSAAPAGGRAGRKPHPRARAARWSSSRSIPTMRWCRPPPRSVMQGAAHEDESAAGRSSAEPIRCHGPPRWTCCSAGRAFAMSPSAARICRGLGTYEYLRDVLGLARRPSRWLGLWQLAKSVGWLQPHRADLLARGAARAVCAAMRATGCMMRAVRRCAIRMAGRCGPGKASRCRAGSSSSRKRSRWQRSTPRRTFRCAAA